jgi:DNA-directed RNA polymerase subunit RPC12/RpoP
MEALKCPSCGSNDLKELSPAEYKCLYCGTGFVITPASTGFVDVVLIGPGEKRTEVIKALRDITCDEKTLKMLDLTSAMRLTDNTPCVVEANVTEEVGERVKARLETAGAMVELKPA